MTRKMRKIRWRIYHFWLEDFADNLEVTELLAPAHSSRDSDSEHTPKVVS